MPTESERAQKKFDIQQADANRQADAEAKQRRIAQEERDRQKKYLADMEADSKRTNEELARIEKARKTGKS